MCSRLFQIYQKRTPTFVAELTTLVASLILLCDPPIDPCDFHSTLLPFYWGIFTIATLEIFTKLVIFAAIYSCDRELAATCSTILLILFAVLHLGAWVYSLILFNRQELEICPVRDRYFMKVYVWAYGAMIVGGIALFVLLMIPAVGVTVFTLKSRRQEEEGEQGV